MNAQLLVGTLYEKGVTLAVDGDDLLVDAPDGVLDDHLVSLIRQHKPAVLALLKRLEGEGGAPARSDRPSSYDSAPSLAQERMLFMEELAGNNSYYNIPVAFDIEGALDKAALASAVLGLVGAHDVLRTVYVAGEHGYVQRVCEPSGFAMEHVCLAGEADQDGALQAVLRREANHVFDLRQEWPIRVALLELGPRHHVLSINIHHIAADGWSARAIVRDIGAGYARCLAGSGAAAARGYQYADYVSWQAAWKESERYRAARDYWLANLKGAPQLHSLPTDHIRPSVQATAGDTWSHALAPSLYAAVDAAARTFSTTPFVMFQCAFAALLARYSGESDIVFGTAAANRQPVEFIDTVGLFVNTLALRYAVDDNVTFADLVAQGVRVSDGAFRHQQLPFDVLVDELQPVRSLGYNPLLQVMLVMQESGQAQLALAGTSVTRLDQRQAVSKFDLALHIDSAVDGVSCNWEYNTSLFKPATIAAMSAHFVRLLEACLADPGRSIDSIALVEAGAAPGALQAHPAAECIHLLIARRIAQFPAAAAVLEGDTRVSYGELDRRADLLARRLVQAGAANGGRVGLCMEKSVELVVGMLAIFKIGAVYVPLDPHYPKERLEFMVEDSGMKILLLNRAARLPEGFAAGVPTMCVNDALEGEAGAPFALASDARAPAYIIYTSGSTGKPKGVQVTHTNLFHSLRANGTTMAFGAGDAMPTIGSQAFGASLLEILLPLISGGAVRILRKAQVADMEQLIAGSRDVTVLHAVPSLMQQWLDAVVAGDGAGQYPNLRLLLVGGESVPAGLLRKIRQWRPSVRLLALYGMTESAIVCSCYEPLAESSAHYCIGKPYPSSRFLVLNRHGQQQPPGVPGELHIGGLCVADGYINQPQMTEEKFIRSAVFGGERLYKTGDRVRLLGDGNYEFLGRVDHQVSLRGARIELGEIETLATGVAGVKQAVAHVVALGDDDKTLVLYYTARAPGQDQAELVAALRAHLTGHLPDYMRPSLIEHLPAFPLNPNGKVDRKKLPQPVVAESVEEPASDIEQELADMWKAMLQRESVSVTANFFEVGGHSLMATRLATRIRASYGIAFPLTSLFASPTIRACAALVERSLEEKYALSLIKGAGEVDASSSEEMII